MKKMLLVILILLPFIVGFSVKGHYWITDKSFEYLPEVMLAFKERFHQPSISGIPPRYMLPDIYEPGHTNEGLAANAETHYIELVNALIEERWNDVETQIGYVAHYCGDAASPTQNSPDAWGQIDDSYDALVDVFLDDITLDADFDEPIKVENIYKYYLDRCRQSAQLADTLIIIHNAAKTEEQIWASSRDIFQQQLNYAVRDLRNVLFTAWDAAGQPSNYVQISSGCTCSPIIRNKILK
ncbi:hypothetical protein JXJ21_02380 [candidate division KSB1 bacterium]|nr:hypothetical protein [candidate division KSB1 bacterium]